MFRSRFTEVKSHAAPPASESSSPAGRLIGRSTAPQLEVAWWKHEVATCGRTPASHGNVGCSRY
jgi:hypothetical protein